jgi:plasmid replication initiation protein
MACNTLTEMKKDITLEQYEAACNGLKESYSKKISEMIESFEAEGEVISTED